MWTRRLLPLLAAAVLAGACGESPADVTTGSGQGADDQSSSTPVESTTTTTTADVESEPGTRPSNDVSRLLLTADDLANWDFSGPMDFPAEPTFESNDCELMNEAWGAHALPGTRVRADTTGITLRQAAVEMPDADAAAAVLDAADTVWETCVELQFGGGQWWSEPVGVPSPDGWRASALVLGSGDTSGWAIGYWQRGSTIVIVDLEGDEVWTHLQSVFAAAAGRLGGEPTPATTPTDPPGVDPNPSVPQLQLPTTLPIPVDDTFPPPGDDWSTHPLAGLAPSPAELGAGWEFGNGSLTEAAPSDADDAIAGCDVVPPPVLDGFELEYRSIPTNEAVSNESEIGILIGGDDVAGAQATIDAFRGVAACDLSEEGMPDGFELPEFNVVGADDAVLLRGRSDVGIDVTVLFGFARFGDLLVGVTYASIDDAEVEPGAGFLSPNAIAELMQTIAAAR